MDSIPSKPYESNLASCLWEERTLHSHLSLKYFLLILLLVSSVSPSLPSYFKTQVTACLQELVSLLKFENGVTRDYFLRILVSVQFILKVRHFSLLLLFPKVLDLVFERVVILVLL